MGLSLKRDCPQLSGRGQFIVSVLVIHNRLLPGVLESDGTVLELLAHDLHFLEVLFTVCPILQHLIILYRRQNYI